MLPRFGWFRQVYYFQQIFDTTGWVRGSLQLGKSIQTARLFWELNAKMFGEGGLVLQLKLYENYCMYILLSISLGLLRNNLKTDLTINLAAIALCNNSGKTLHWDLEVFWAVLVVVLSAWTAKFRSRTRQTPWGFSAIQWRPTDYILPIREKGDTIQI